MMENYEFIVKDTKIKMRRDTGARWALYNPILRYGEVGLDLEKGKIKRGDGISTWTELDWWAILL